MTVGRQAGQPVFCDSMLVILTISVSLSLHPPLLFALSLPVVLFYYYKFSGAVTNFLLCEP